MNENERKKKEFMLFCISHFPWSSKGVSPCQNCIIIFMNLVVYNFTVKKRKKYMYFLLGQRQLEHQEQSAVLYFNRQGVLCICTEYIVMSTQRDIKLAQYGEMCNVVSQGFKTVHYPLSFRRQSSK